MNDYVISPALIYWLGRINGILSLMTVLTFASAAVLTFFTVKYFIEKEDASWYEPSKNFCKWYKKFLPIMIIVLVVNTIGTIFIPTKEELMKMYLCKYATKTNAEKVLDVLDEKTDALIEAIGKGGK